jgi:GR25 family glycosyltransferase involved in LPS biosynthesis
VLGDSKESLVPPIYVISLERATDRWEAASKQMDKAGLTINKLPAVDGRQLSNYELSLVSTGLATFLQPRGNSLTPS